MATSDTDIENKNSENAGKAIKNIRNTRPENEKKNRGKAIKRKPGRPKKTSETEITPVKIEQIIKLAAARVSVADAAEIVGCGVDTCIKYGDFSKTKRGAKPKMEWTEKELKQLEEMMALGLRPEQAARIFGISDATLYNNAKEYRPEIYDALERGRAKGLMVSSNALQEQIMKGNINAIKWYETTRHNMSERVEQVNTNYVIETVPRVEDETEWERMFKDTE